MQRWLLVGALWALVGVLAALFWLGWRLERTGVPVRLTGDTSLSVRVAAPLEVGVSSFPWQISPPFSVTVAGSVGLDTPIPRCPACGEGPLIPVRWDLLSGTITWRCLHCGREFGP